MGQQIDNCAEKLTITERGRDLILAPSSLGVNERVIRPGADNRPPAQRNYHG